MEGQASDNEVTSRIPQIQKICQQLIEDVTAHIKQEVADDHCTENPECFSESRIGYCGTFDVLRTKVDCNDAQESSATLKYDLQSFSEDDEEKRGICSTPFVLRMKKEEDQPVRELCTVFSSPKRVTLPTEVKQEEETKIDVYEHVLYKCEPRLGKEEAYEEDTECCKPSELHENSTRKGFDDAHSGTFVDTCNIKGEYNAHLMGKTGSKPGCHVETFVCFRCNYSATEKNCLTRHTKQHHKVTVQNCSETKQQTNTDLYQCTECDYTTKLKYNLKKHVARKHSSDGPYQCKECDFNTKLRCYLTRHVKIKHNPNGPVYQCLQCNYKTKLRWFLTRHVTLKHSVDAPLYQCAQCHYRSKVKHTLRVHIRVFHQSPKVYKCPHCDYTPKYKRNLIQHLTIQHDPNAKLYECTDCGYASKSRTVLTRHVTIKHNPDAPLYQCTECTYTTKWRQNLSAHIRTLHNRHAELIKCPHCQFATKQKYRLTKHLKLQHDNHVLYQ